MRRILLLILLTGLAGISIAGMMGNGMGGMMGSQASPPSPPDKDAGPKIRQGYQLVETYCVQCHQAPNPAQHSAADWPAVVSRMQTYMKQQHRPVPSAADRQRILDYLSMTK